MSYGDGFASLIGTKFGKRKFNICGDEKSIEGSISMFAVTILVSLAALYYYGVDINIAVIIAISSAATLVESITPKVWITLQFLFQPPCFIMSFHEV